MKNIYKILLIATIFGVLSCSKDKNDPSEYLTVDISGSGILIPDKTQSCEQLSTGELGTGAVAGTYFSLSNPIFTWTGPSPELSEIRIVALKLTLKSPKISGEYSCLFSDTSLGAMYYKREQIGGSTEAKTTLWNGVLGKDGATTRTSSRDLVTSEGYTACNIRCGGISIPAKAGQFSLTGVWEVIGVQKKYKASGSTDFDEYPIRVQGDFSVQNVLN